MPDKAYSEREKYVKFLNKNPNHNLSDYKVSELLGIRRPSIQRWRHEYKKFSENFLSNVGRQGKPKPVINKKEIPSKSYAYLLGMYLGDGHITQGKGKKHAILVITQNLDDDIAINDIKRHMANIFSYVTPYVHKKKNANACDIRIGCNQNVLPLFPQHGRGAKHKRKIELTNWQKDHIRKEPWAFIKGLLHSDGSKFYNKCNKTWTWEFKNKSQDIIDIFKWACDLVDLYYTYGKKGSVCFYKKEYVSILNEKVGEKRKSHIGREDTVDI